MSQQGIQAISKRAEGDRSFRECLRIRPLHALEGYDLTLAEHTTLETLAENGWLMPGEGPSSEGSSREGRSGDGSSPRVVAPDNSPGCLARLKLALRKLLQQK